jgi:hypothetical protein
MRSATLAVLAIHSTRNLAVALAVCAFIAATAAAMAAPTPPNIVFIIADDMGFGDTACYNPHGKIPATKGQAQGHRCKPHHPAGTLSKRRPQRAHPQVAAKIQATAFTKAIS